MGNITKGTIWKCVVCGFMTKSKQGKEIHMRHAKDKAHQELIREKAKNVVITAKIKEDTSLKELKKIVNSFQEA
jgi:hypothetical protein